jgi:hypothetical protein
MGGGMGGGIANDMYNNDMYNNDGGKGGAYVYEAYEAK